MTSGTLLVIGNKTYSSWSLRGWLALRKAGERFEELVLPLDTPEFAERIGRYSASRQVPALHLEGAEVWDSLAIGELMAERHPEAMLLPEDARARALMRCVVAEMHAGFAALRRELPMNCRVRGRQRTISDAVRSDIDRIGALWRQCMDTKPRAGGDWLFGHFTLADAAFVPVALRFHSYGVELDARCQAYLATCLADPDVAAWMADAEREPWVIAEEEVGAPAPGT